MKSNFVHIKIKDKTNIILNKIHELYKISVGNKIINLNYNKNIKDFQNQNLEIIYYKDYVKKNIGKMLYKTIGNKEIKILNKIFIVRNMKRAKLIINNKQYNLIENIDNKKHKDNFKTEMKFLDNIIHLNSMFKECKSLSYIKNFKNINTKYLSTIYELFSGCNSLLDIDDISNWNINNINNINSIFYECSSLKSLPNISEWNTSKIIDMTCLFSKCTSLKELPDILNGIYRILAMYLECLMNVLV